MTILAPVRANGDGTLGAILFVGGDGTAWSCIDNGDPAVGQPDTGYIYNQGSTTVDAHFLLADFPADLAKVDSLVLETYTVPVGRADDNITMQVSVMAADEVTRLAGNANGSAGVVVSGAANPSGYHVSTLFLTAAGASADLATWNGARIRVNWVYTQSMSKDPYDLRLHAIQLEGTYTQAAASTTGTGAGTTTPVTGSGAATTFTPRPPVTDLTDDFTVQDTGKWGGWSPGTVEVQSGRLALTLPATPGYPGLRSVAKYDLTGTSFTVEAVQVLASGAASGSFLQVELGGTNDNTLELVAEANQVKARAKVAGAFDDGGAVTYDPAAHRWWRIREAAGTILWEVSPTGVADSWTALRTLANPFSEAWTKDVTLLLTTGYFTGTETGTTLFDNANLPPAPTVAGTGSGATTPVTGSGASTSSTSGTGSGQTTPVTGTGGAAVGTAGTGAGTTTPATGSGSSVSSSPGSGAGTTTPATGSGSATSSTGGTGSGATEPVTGSGTAGAPVNTGTGAGTTTPATGSGQATTGTTGTGAGTTEPVTGTGQAGTETPTTTGSGSGTTDPVQGAGQATSTTTGTGTGTTDPATGSGASSSTATGGGAGTTEPVQGDGETVAPSGATGAGTLDPVTGSGQAGSSTTGTGTGTTDPTTGEGQGAASTEGTGTGTTAPVEGSGTADPATVPGTGTGALTGVQGAGTGSSSTTATGTGTTDPLTGAGTSFSSDGPPTTAPDRTQDALQPIRVQDATEPIRVLTVQDRPRTLTSLEADMETRLKDPAARLDYAVDWTTELAQYADSVATSTWTIDGTGTLSQESLNGDVARVMVDGGTPGTVETLTNSIVTTGGREDRRSWRLKIGSL